MERVLSVALDITAGTDDTGLRARLQPLPAQCEQAFVDTVLGTVPEIPDYYRRMKEVNSAGPILLSALPGGARLGMDEFEAKRQSLDATVVDLRRPEAFGGAHIPGSISIGAGPNLSSWAAWVLLYGKPILLVGDVSTDLEEARRAFIRIGLDTVVGSLRGGNCRVDRVRKSSGGFGTELLGNAFVRGAAYVT